MKGIDTHVDAIDVLMVFHSHMLNPRSFLEDAMRFGARQLWTTGFPWVQVNQAIDTNFNYNVPADTKTAWSTQTGHAWDNIDDPLTINIGCPGCEAQVHIPWTTCGMEEHPATDA